MRFVSVLGGAFLFGFLVAGCSGPSHQVNPNITVRWSLERRNVFWVSHAAMNFAKVINAIITAATLILSQSRKKAR